MSVQSDTANGGLCLQSTGMGDVVGGEEGLGSHFNSLLDYRYFQALK